MSREDYKQKLSVMKTIVQNNGYSQNLIENLVNRQKKKRILNSLYRGNKENDKEKWHVINFIGSKSNKICRKLRRTGLNLLCVNKNNIASLLSNQKTRNLQKAKKWSL